MSYDSDDMIEKRKRRSKLRSLRNLLIFLLIVGFCVDPEAGGDRRTVRFCDAK